jgi:parallel beta-helix repeat protein
VLINANSNDNILSGNFIGTDADGLQALGNGLNGVEIENSKNNSLIGCTLLQNPFVFYNVISGNKQDGVRLSNADNITIHANFIGISARNNSRIPNVGNGLSVLGTSKKTQVGGVIPLGNVISGNDGNGIAVLDKASGFISFNTFGGIYAFAGAAPNGRNGILINSTGGDNIVRTCIISGNLWNGIEIGGDASGVQVMDTACGTNTDIDAAIPNSWNGILIKGTAHNNSIGGFKPSIETRNHMSGNSGYGVSITDRAYNNSVYNTNIGYGDSLSDGFEPSIPNGWGGLLLDQGTSGSIVGGKLSILSNKIISNEGAGLTIWASTKNSIVGNKIEKNTEFGIYGEGACTGTVINSNSIRNNGSVDYDNVDISDATGIRYTR